VAADVVNSKAFLDHKGDMNAIRGAGGFALQGKQYVIQAGDIIRIRHAPVK